jgi:hypothetical protein
MLVRARQGPEESQPQRERDGERDRDRDAREAERLDRAIARYQRRHDESQREFHSAWDSERARAVGGGRVPNEHSPARADALRRHVDNAHRLWHLMHQRSRLSVPPAEADAPLEMRHLLGTPTFRRGPLRPRRARPGSGWLQRLDNVDDPAEPPRDRDWLYDDSDEDDWPARRAQMVERLARMRAIAAQPPLVVTREAERREAERRETERRELERRQPEQDDGFWGAAERMTARLEIVQRANEAGRENMQRMIAALAQYRPGVPVQSTEPTSPWNEEDEAALRAFQEMVAEDEREPPAARDVPGGISGPLEDVPGGLSAPLENVPGGLSGPLENVPGSLPGRVEDDGDAARRALLSNLSSTLTRLNAAARRAAPERLDDEDVLERVERARERVAELSRIQRDLEAVRAGMRRGSDATVVPSDWVAPHQSEDEPVLTASPMPMSEAPEASAAEPADPSVAGASTTATSGTDDEDKESGTLRADDWPEAPNRAAPRPYVSLLDL